MVRSYTSLFGYALISLAVSGQTDITWNDSVLVVPKIPVVVDGTTVLIGGCQHERKNVHIVVDGREIAPDSRKGREALKEDPMDLQTAFEDTETLIIGVNESIAPLLGSDSLRIDAEQGHEQWIRAREAHCGQIQAGDEDAQRIDHLKCMTWVSECRLNDLLQQYDDLIATKKP